MNKKINKQKNKQKNNEDTKLIIEQEVAPNPFPSKGVYSEYLNQRLTPDQLLAERKKQLKRISELREGRDILVYASDFKKGGVAPVLIDPSDLMPISDQISFLDGDRLDLLLETGGGFGDAAEDIVKLLRNKYKELNFIIPGTAKSAGTIMAMAGDDILMEPASSLGPIDAQINYQGKQFSADAFIQGLEDIKAEADAKKELNRAYIPILQTISPGEIRHAQNAMEFARRLVREWLVQYKFKNWTQRKRNGEAITEKERKDRASEIADKLSKHKEWLSHSKSIKIDDLIDMELMITDYSKNDELADAVRRYKILLQITFDTTGIYKIYETEKSQINKEITPNIPLSLPGLIGQPAQIPQNVEDFVIDFDCGKCHHITKIQARLNKSVALKNGFIHFPITNKLKCPSCGTEHDLLTLRRQLESQTGKKILS